MHSQYGQHVSSPAGREPWPTDAPRRASRARFPRLNPAHNPDNCCDRLPFRRLSRTGSAAPGTRLALRRETAVPLESKRRSPDVPGLPGLLRVWLRRGRLAWRASPDEALPIAHRLAILYLTLPLALWLLGWFRWWVGWPLAVLLGAGVARALTGPWRGRPRPATWGLLATAGIWVMTSAAGGLVDTLNADWPIRRALLLDLGRYAWPPVLPDPLAAYVPGASPLLRYYLGWHLVPGLAARLWGPSALQWAVPLWTWFGTSLVLSLFAREYRGWRAAAAAALLIVFSGLDVLRGFLEGWQWPFDNFEGAPLRVGLMSPVRELTSGPHHFLSTGLLALLLWQLRRQPRFLAVSGIVLAAAPLWSALGAIGAPPLAAALAWTNSGLRRFWRWPNLVAAGPLAGLVLLYLTADTGSWPRGWLWERHEWTFLARWLPASYLSEFLLLAGLLLGARPALRREPFFLACLATLLLLPLYTFGYFNAMRHGLSAARMLLAVFCAAVALQPSRRDRRWLRAALVAALALGAVNPVREWTDGLRQRLPFRYAASPLTTLLVPHSTWYLRQYVAFARPPLLAALLKAPAPVAAPRLGAPDVRGPVDVHWDGRSLIYAQAPCRPSTAESLFLQVRPTTFAAFEPAWQFYRLGLGAPVYGASPDYEGYGRHSDAACAWRWIMPPFAFEVASLRTGQAGRWEAELFLDDAGILERVAYQDAYALQATYDALAAAPPAAADRFAARLAPAHLALTRAGCADADLAAPFYLHVVPFETADLPLSRRRYGFAARNFPFAHAGSRVADRCWAVLPLPAYGIRALRLGQFAPEGELWRLELPFAAYLPSALAPLRAAYAAASAQTPAVRDRFDVYVADRTATFVKAPCRPEDAEAKFILHVIPVRRWQLPPAHWMLGFANLGFSLEGHGARFDGVCLARKALPAYPIARLRVGQFLSREQRVLWQTEIPFASVASP